MNSPSGRRFLPRDQDPLECNTGEPTCSNEPQRKGTRRSNQEWVEELSNAHNKNVQFKAHSDLANYLFVVAYNYLNKRRENLQMLNQLPTEEIASLTEDAVQDFMEKLVRDEYALLSSYRGVSVDSSLRQHRLCATSSVRNCVKSVGKDRNEFPRFAQSRPKIKDCFPHTHLLFKGRPINCSQDHLGQTFVAAEIRHSSP